MPSSYEIWILDDSGRRIVLLDKTAYFSYSRTVKGYGTCLIGLPYAEFRERVFPVFQPDRRIDIWRSPETGFPMRREGTYLLRMHKIYTRETDGVQLIAFYGRDLKDLLRRRWVIQPAGYAQTYKTDFIDDMMKEIVSEQMLWGSALDADAVADNTRAFPENEFTVQGDVSLGPVHTHTFSDRNVLDVLKELEEASFQLHEEDITNERIYFDIIPYELEGQLIYILDEDGMPILDEEGEPLLDESSLETNAIQGFQFVTFAGLRGQDRTASALVFSEENNNLEAPYYTFDYMDEENSVVVKGFGRGDSRPSARVTDSQRAGMSRWNLCEGFQDASTEPDQNFLEDYAYPRLRAEQAREELSAVFLNVPRSEDTPRSLYSLDWDLGDMLPVDYAGKRFNVEIEIVYVAIDENGRETITGRSGMNASDQTG
jgi:hypothetical protein